MIKTQERIAHFKALGVQFLDAIPEGWKEIEGASTAPSKGNPTPPARPDRRAGNYRFS